MLASPGKVHTRSSWTVIFPLKIKSSFKKAFFYTRCFLLADPSGCDKKQKEQKETKLTNIFSVLYKSVEGMNIRTET